MEPGLRRRIALLLTPGTLWITTIYVIPALLIVAYSFLTPQPGGGVEWRFSLDTYRRLLEPDERATIYSNYVTVLLRSVVWAAITTAACFVLALPLAVFIDGRRSAIVRNGLIVAVMIPFWTSMLVRTYALRFLMSNTGPVNEALRSLGGETLVLLNTPAAVLIGLVYTSLPFMILPLYAAVVRVDHRLLEAGRDLGANSVRTFLRVFVPLIRPGVVVGGLLVFVLSVSQYIVPTLLGGGKVNMISNLIQLQFGVAFNWPLGAGLAIFFSGLTLLGLWVLVGRREAAELL